MEKNKTWQWDKVAKDSERDGHQEPKETTKAQCAVCVTAELFLLSQNKAEMRSIIGKVDKY